MSADYITTVLTAASSYDLTDLATVHDELDIPTTDTSLDSKFSRYITEMSSAISAYCKRVFAIETVQDLIYLEQDFYPYQTPGGIHKLQLSRWPLVKSASVALTGNTHGSTTVDGMPSTVGVVDNSLVFAVDGSIPAGTTIVSHTSNSIVLSQAATTSVSGQSLFTGLQVQQILDDNGTTQLLTYGHDFQVEPNTGLLLRIDGASGGPRQWEAMGTMVQYQAGYASSPSGLPADLISATLRMVLTRYRLRDRDPTVVERNTSGVVERYWIGQMPGQDGGAFPPEVLAIVDNYRVPTIGQ